MSGREERVLKAADEVLHEWEGYVSTHYRDCWKRHVACFAMLVRDILQDDERNA